jgi:hypothetical protein
MSQNSIQALMGQNTDYLVMQNQTKPLINKWKKSGLLEGLDTSYDVAGMAVLLENQAKRLIAEATTTGNTTNSEAWSGVALPLVRRIFGEIAAKDFVSVQPMNLPSGLVFFLDFKYSGTGAQPGFAANSSLFGGSGARFGRTDTTTNGLYGAGRFGFTSNETSSIVAVTTQSVSQNDVNFDSRIYASTSSYKTYLVANYATAFPNLDVEAVRAMVPESSGSVHLVKGFLPEFTKVTGSSLMFVVSSSGWGSVGANDGIKINYLVTPTQDSRGDFEDLKMDYSAAGTNTGSINTSPNIIPQVELQMKSEAIIAKTKKLKAQWTPEMAQDLNAYHSIDAEAELTSMLSEYISMEIDLEILDMLIINALTTDKWSAINNRYWTGTAWEGTGASGGLGFYNQQGTWFATLGTKMRKISNKIHQLTMRGGANFVVVSPDVATILDSIPGYAASDRGEKMKFAMGVQKVGSMASQYDVYVNPYMTENLILLGFRGSQFLETGAVYAPYIPLMMTPLVYDPNTYTPNRGVMTRYAKKMLRPEFFGLIQVEGLGTL